MKPEEIKELILGSLDAESDPGKVYSELEQEGLVYDFGKGFSESVLDRLFPLAAGIRQEIEFMRSMSFAFRSIAISGAAAIIVLMISIFLMEGSFSVNSLLGLKDNYDESIICLLTGN